MITGWEVNEERLKKVLDGIVVNEEMAFQSLLIEE